MVEKESVPATEGPLAPEIARQMAHIARGAVEIIEAGELAARIRRSLETGIPLRVKAGFDPTAPDLHLGHTVLIHKLRHFQELGHRVVFIIGDFTGLIGDPTGRSETRRAMTREDLAANAVTYQNQVFKILDPSRTEVVFNSEWLSKLSFEDVVRLAARSTVARMLERDDFEKRYREQRPIGVHEFLYPLMQGYDSVAIKADVEMGGTDQKFNLLMGRELQRDYGQPPQIVLTMPILEGLDGVQKMSKSLGNYVGISEGPDEIFGKLMSISDALMWRYYELLSSASLEEIAAMRRECDGGGLHPMEAKKRLAAEIAARYHGPDAGREAREGFERRFQKRLLPESLEEATVAIDEESIRLPNLLKEAGLVESAGEGRRMILQRAVRLLDESGETLRVLEIVDDKFTPGCYILRRGSRSLKRVFVVGKKTLDTQ
jgi:tyrosyl-tRNA synthetase